MLSAYRNYFLTPHASPTHSNMSQPQADSKHIRKPSTLISPTPKTKNNSPLFHSSFCLPHMLANLPFTPPYFSPFQTQTTLQYMNDPDLPPLTHTSMPQTPEALCPMPHPPATATQAQDRPQDNSKT